MLVVTYLASRTMNKIYFKINRAWSEIQSALPGAVWWPGLELGYVEGMSLETLRAIPGVTVVEKP